MRRHTEFAWRMAGRLAVVLAAIAWALLWAGLPAPAEAQSSSDATLSQITVDGENPVQTNETVYRYGVAAETAQVTVSVTPTVTGATFAFNIADADPDETGFQLSLTRGQANSVFVIVTATDGAAMLEYTIYVSRGFEWRQRL